MRKKLKKIIYDIWDWKIKLKTNKTFTKEPKTKMLDASNC
jgi:hypothetical protein